MELLERLDESSCLALESALPSDLHPELHRLRRDALEELALEDT